MLKRLLVAMVFATSNPLSLGDVSVSVRLDPDAPVGIVTADIFADVAISDAWTLGGIRAVAMNGATLRYGGENDPNTAYHDGFIAPY